MDRRWALDTGHDRCTIINNKGMNISLWESFWHHLQSVHTSNFKAVFFIHSVHMWCTCGVQLWMCSTYETLMTMTELLGNLHFLQVDLQLACLRHLSCDWSPATSCLFDQLSFTLNYKPHPPQTTQHFKSRLCRQDITWREKLEWRVRYDNLNFEHWTWALTEWRHEAETAATKTTPHLTTRCETLPSKM